MADPPPEVPSREGASRRLRLAVVGVVVLLASLLPRLENAPRAFRDGWLQVAPFDELYHARRILLSAESPSQILRPDPLRGAGGAFCPWPPLYDLGVGQVASLLGGRSPHDVLRIAAFVPPLLSSLAAAVLALAVARATSLAAGLLAGLAFAWTPTLVGAARVGAIDHHFLEGPLVLGILAAVLPLVREGSPVRLRQGVVLGGALLLALLVQTALVLYAGVALAAVLGAGGDRPDSLRAAALGFGTASAGLLLYRAVQPDGYPGGPWFLGAPHAALLLAAAAACGVAGSAAARGAGRVPAGGVGLGAGLLAFAAFPGALPALAEGSGFLAGSAWFGSIQEFRPLFAAGAGSSLHDLSFVGGGVLLAVPLLLVGVERRSRPLTAVGLFTLAVAASAVTRARLAVIAAPAGALAAALVVDALRRRRRPALAWLAALSSLAPGAFGTFQLVRSRAAQIPAPAAPFLATAQALRRLPPRTGAILGPWSWGHALGIGSGRRVVVDNFGLMGDRTLFEDAVAAPYLPGERGLAQLCERTGVRFVVVTDSLSAVGSQVATGGRSPLAFLDPGTAGGPPRPTRLLAASFWYRAQTARGEAARTAGTPSSAFRRFRLVSVAGGGALPRVQVWELVFGSPAGRPGGDLAPR